MSQRHYCVDYRRLHGKRGKTTQADAGAVARRRLLDSPSVANAAATLAAILRARAAATANHDLAATLFEVANQLAPPRPAAS